MAAARPEHRRADAKNEMPSAYRFDAPDLSRSPDLFVRPVASTAVVDNAGASNSCADGISDVRRIP
jgi:hypothetical protein